MELNGKVVALFSGQGSQYLEMGRELVMNFHQMQRLYSYIDSLLLQDNCQPLSSIVFPHPVFDATEKEAQIAALQRTEYTQPAIGMLSAGMYKILTNAGFKSDFTAGHSFGELTALWAAGVFSDEDYCFLVKARGQAMSPPQDPDYDAGAMLAVREELSKVEAVLKQHPHVSIANYNSQNQIVLAGSTLEISNVRQALQEHGYSAILLPVSAAFHTSKIAFAQKAFAIALKSVNFQTPKIPVYSNVTGNIYSNEPKTIQRLLETHLANSVLFKQEIENIYQAGGYCFVEFGPKKILTNLVKDILGNRPHLAIALNASPQKNSYRALREAALQLRVAGMALKNLDPYQISQQPTTKTNKDLSIRINGVNYISEKTQKTRTEALQEKSLEKLITKPKFEPVSKSMKSVNPQSQTSNGHHPKPQIENITNNTINGKLKTSLPTPLLQGEGSDCTHPSIVEKASLLPTQPASNNLVYQQQVLSSLEYILAQFQQNQSENSQLHGLYLNHQKEYTQTFSQLIQQQNTLFAPSTSNPEIKPLIIESLERSMMQFHSQQSETLRIHEQYLQHQAEHTKNLFQFIQQEYATIVKANLSSINPVKVEPVLPPVAKLEITEQEIKEQEITETKKEVTQVEIPVPSINKIVEPVAPKEEPVIINQVVEQLYSATQTVVATPDLSDLSNLSDKLLTITSEKTGYPIEMLELDMDMEADLGIDSIKRVEIMGALQEAYPELPQLNLEELSEKRTIGQIVEYIQKLSGIEKKKCQFDTIDIVDTGIKRLPAQLKKLNEPDWLDFNLPQESVALVTDDGSATTAKVAQQLNEKGWKVVVLNLPPTLVPEKSVLPLCIERVTLTDVCELHLQQKLQEIATTYGSIGAFIHIHPLFQAELPQGISYSQREKAIVKHIFFIAKYLKKSLIEAAQIERACFCTVARLDGAFGLTNQVNFGAIGSGLFGLTKTMIWESANVFCRAIDLSPQLDADTSARCIIAELHDPNRYLTEVAYGSHGRVTLIAK
jgi:acyl transferase domain-containing protein